MVRVWDHPSEEFAAVVTTQAHPPKECLAMVMTQAHPPKECAAVVLELKKRPRPRSPSLSTPVAVMNTLAGLMSVGEGRVSHYSAFRLSHSAGMSQYIYVPP